MTLRHSAVISGAGTEGAVTSLPAELQLCSPSADAAFLPRVLSCSTPEVAALRERAENEKQSGPLQKVTRKWQRSAFAASLDKRRTPDRPQQFADAELVPGFVFSSQAWALKAFCFPHEAVCCPAPPFTYSSLGGRM